MTKDTLTQTVSVLKIILIGMESNVFNVNHSNFGMKLLNLVNLALKLSFMTGQLINVFAHKLFHIFKMDDALPVEIGKYGMPTTQDVNHAQTAIPYL